MKMKPILTVAFASLCCVATMAQAQESRYWSVQGGLNNVSDWPAKVNFGGPTVDAGLKIDGGAQFGAAIGKQYDQARYELEYQHGMFDIDSITVAGIVQNTNASGKYDVLTANASRTLPINAATALYAGVGIGYGRVNLPRLAVAGGCKCIEKASKGSLAYQARLGVEYRVNERGLAFLQLGWLSLPGARSDGNAYVSYPRKGFATRGVGYRGHFDQ
jgi:opacity protein-like surface antigen